MDKFKDGKFVYETYVSADDVVDRVEISLDLNHNEIRRMIWRAQGNKSRRTTVAGGALVVKVSRP